MSRSSCTCRRRCAPRWSGSVDPTGSGDVRRAFGSRGRATFARRLGLVDRSRRCAGAPLLARPVPDIALVVPGTEDRGRSHLSTSGIEQIPHLINERDLLGHERRVTRHSAEIRPTRHASILHTGSLLWWPNRPRRSLSSRPATGAREAGRVKRYAVLSATRGATGRSQDRSECGPD